MTRYVKQKNDYSCGILAVINALKWAGYSYTYDQLYAILKDLLKTDKESGTVDTNLHKVLKLFSSGRFNVTYKKSISYKYLNSMIEQGNAAILLTCLYNHHNEALHYYLIIGKDGDKFVTVNLFSDTNVKVSINKKDIKLFLSKSRLKRYIKDNNIEKEYVEQWFKHYPQAWILTNE
jgi:hypothetical protein